jgi:hypothetical protein
MLDRIVLANRSLNMKVSFPILSIHGKHFQRLDGADAAGIAVVSDVACRSQN